MLMLHNPHGVMCPITQRYNSKATHNAKEREGNGLMMCPITQRYNSKAKIGRAHV